jgi:hypothetical protein
MFNRRAPPVCPSRIRCTSDASERQLLSFAPLDLLLTLSMLARNPNHNYSIMARRGRVMLHRGLSISTIIGATLSTLRCSLPCLVIGGNALMLPMAPLCHRGTSTRAPSTGARRSRFRFSLCVSQIL